MPIFSVQHPNWLKELINMKKVAILSDLSNLAGRWGLLGPWAPILALLGPPDGVYYADAA